GVQTHVQTHTHAHADIQSHTHKHYKCTQYHTNIETAICKNQNSHIKHNFLRYLRNSEAITETDRQTDRHTCTSYKRTHRYNLMYISATSHTDTHTSHIPPTISTHTGTISCT